jgi:peptidoglycan hydrolase-like protein with peptidoglycan-binding domain
MAESSEPRAANGRPPWLIPVTVAIVAIGAIVLALIITRDDASSTSEPSSPAATANEQSSESSEGPAVSSTASTPSTVGADDGDGPEDAACPEYTMNDELPLMLCDSGIVVRSMQEGLTRAGHPVDADSFFGPSTRDAVIAFQTAQGLEVDGLFGPATAAALEAVNSGG